MAGAARPAAFSTCGCGRPDALAPGALQARLRPRDGRLDAGRAPPLGLLGGGLACAAASLAAARAATAAAFACSVSCAALSPARPVAPTSAVPALMACALRLAALGGVDGRGGGLLGGCRSGRCLGCLAATTDELAERRMMRCMSTPWFDGSAVVAPHSATRGRGLAAGHCASAGAPPTGGATRSALGVRTRRGARPRSRTGPAHEPVRGPWETVPHDRDLAHLRR